MSLGDYHGRVLSIQSSVVFGYVGNKASNFPLQLLGFDVDPIHSCQLSNHTGYPSFTGRKHSGEELKKLAQGICRNKFHLRFSHLLTGYMGNESFLRAAAEFVQKIKRDLKKKVFFVCDPVLGDGGRMYVPESFVKVYCELMLPYCDMLTPNQTEAALLTGLTIRTLSDCLTACVSLHRNYPQLQYCVITSADLQQDEKTEDDTSEGDVRSVGNRKDKQKEQSKVLDILATVREGSAVCDSCKRVTGDRNTRGTANCLHMQVPLRQAKFSGTGDLVAALLLAHMTRAKNQRRQGEDGCDYCLLSGALHRSICTVQGILNCTQSNNSRLAQQDEEDKEYHESKDTGMWQELKLVQSSPVILNPSLRLLSPPVLKQIVVEDTDTTLTET